VQDKIFAMASQKKAPREKAPRKPVRGHDTRYVRLQKNYCFACGKNNPEGMRLRFTYDEGRDCFVWASASPDLPATATAASLRPSSMKPWAR